MVLYVAGKYSGKDEAEIESHIDLARKVSIELWSKGHAVICPHTNTAHWDKYSELQWDDFLRGDFDLIRRCDGIVMLENWKESKGANLEHDLAKKLGMPIWYYPEMPELHPTEKLCPAQARGFVEAVMKMYRVHLEKNADYSPANILGTGEVGLVTRLWDKMARLMNLTGFHLEVKTSEYRAPKIPKNESIEDNYLDLSVYGIIGKLLREDSWGK